MKNFTVENSEEHGWAVLNSEDEHCVQIAKDLHCNIAYFSMVEFHPVIVQHCKQGGTAAVYENGFIIIKNGD